MRVVYCVTVYRNPEQVARLIDRIYSPSDYFYIHRDKRTPSDERWEAIPRKYRNGNVLSVCRHRTPRCTFSLVEPILDAMDYCRDLDYDYFANLTGQCYPIKPLSVIKQQLESKKNAAYMEYFKLPSTHWAGENGGLDRLKYFIPFPSRAGSDDGRGLRIIRLNKTLPDGLEPYGGSFLFCLPRRFVEYISDYVSNHHQVVSFYKHAYMVGEMFFQTIVMNSPLRRDVVNEQKTLVRWVGLRGGHPAVLRKEDFEEIMQSDKLFARKFDINIDSDILDLIDREIQRDSS